MDDGTAPLLSLMSLPGAHVSHIIRAEGNDLLGGSPMDLSLSFKVLGKPAASRLDQCLRRLRLVPLACGEDCSFPASFELWHNWCFRVHGTSGISDLFHIMANRSAAQRSRDKHTQKVSGCGLISHLGADTTIAVLVRAAALNVFVVLPLIPVALRRPVLSSPARCLAVPAIRVAAMPNNKPKRSRQYRLCVPPAPWPSACRDAITIPAGTV
jgi:hypothetical protein